MQFPDAPWDIEDTTWPAALRDELGPRRLRLFLSGCCRGYFKESIQKEVLQAFDISDRYADTGKTKSDLREARQLVKNTPRSKHRPGGEMSGDLLGDLIMRKFGDAFTLLEDLLVPDLPIQLLPRIGIGAEFNLKVERAKALAYLQRVLDEMTPPDMAAQQFDNRWRTFDVLGLARAIYKERVFERMPILADALMDAGCGDESIIRHCRGDSLHARGCWVLDLILDGQWATVWQESRSAPKLRPEKAQSVFKLKPSAKRALDVCLEDDGKLKLADSIIEQFGRSFPYSEAAVRDYARLLGWSQDHTRAYLPFSKSFAGPAQLRERGIARRIAHDNPRELTEYCCASARADWMFYCHDEAEPVRKLDTLILGLAVHDQVLEHRFRETSAFPLQTGHPDDIFHYNAVYALLTEDLTRLRQMFPHNAKRKPNRYMGSCLECFAAVAGDSAELFSKSLNECLDSHRRSYSGQVGGLIDTYAHGIYELCRRVAPEVVATFDVNRPPPWDAEFHRWIQNCDDPLQNLDWKKIPEEIRDGLRYLPRPAWWDARPL
jgi:hypothetical protein